MTLPIRLASTLATLALTACTAAQGPVTTFPAPDPLPPDKEPVASDKVPDNAGEVFIDDSGLLVAESFPIQVRLDVGGSVPTPCHGLSWVVEDDGATISVTMFSIEPGPEVSCIAVLEPFQVSVDLGTFADQSRVVELNGQIVGDFSS